MFMSNLVIFKDQIGCFYLKTCLIRVYYQSRVLVEVYGGLSARSSYHFCTFSNKLQRKFRVFLPAQYQQRALQHSSLKTHILESIQIRTKYIGG